MNFLKLFLVFAVILALIVGALFISSGSEDYHTAGVNTAYVEEMRDSIENSWGEAASPEWDRERYDSMKMYIDLYKSELGGSYEDLYLLFRINAFKALYNSTIAEYGKPNASDSVIGDYNNERLNEFSGLISDSEKNKALYYVGLNEELAKVYELYIDAMKFAGKKYRYYPQFTEPETPKSSEWYVVVSSSNGTGYYQWLNIKTYHERDKSKRKKILDNPYYGRICNITAISEPLSQSSFNKTLAEAKKWHYDELNKEIKDHFERKFNAAKQACEEKISSASAALDNGDGKESKRNLDDAKVCLEQMRNIHIDFNAVRSEYKEYSGMGIDDISYFRDHCETKDKDIMNLENRLNQ